MLVKLYVVFGKYFHLKNKQKRNCSFFKHDNITPNTLLSAPLTRLKHLVGQFCHIPYIVPNLPLLQTFICLNHWQKIFMNFILRTLKKKIKTQCAPVTQEQWFLCTMWEYMPLYKSGQKLSKPPETTLRSNFFFKKYKVLLYFSVNFTCISFERYQYIRIIIHYICSL